MDFVPLVISIAHKKAHGIIDILAGIQRVAGGTGFFMVTGVILFVIVLRILFLDMGAIEQHDGGQAAGRVG